MSGYYGARCPVCKKKFVEGYDIVVCPVCGAPHHRDCYALEGKCAFEEEHMSGKAWAPEEKEDASGDFCINPQDGQRWTNGGVQSKTCAYCGAQNPKDNLFCCTCGNRLVEANLENQDPRKLTYNNFRGIDPTVAVYGGLSPTDSIDEFSVKEVAAYVGRSSAYYLPRFKRAEKKTLDFSLSAFLFGFLYFFYRKMYKVGVVLLVVTLLLSLPSLLYSHRMFPILVKDALTAEQAQQIGINKDKLTVSADDMKKIESYENANFITSVINTVLRITLGLFASRIYCKHTVKQMRKIKEEHSSGGAVIGVVQGEEILRKEGGVNTGVVIAIVGTIFAVMLVYTFYALKSLGG